MLFLVFQEHGVKIFGYTVEGDSVNIVRIIGEYSIDVPLFL